MAAQWDEAAEPRLRELGLMTRLLTDDSPQGWADSILVRAESGSAFLQPVAEFVAGVGATWPAAARAPIPSEGADWRLWSHWMNGSHPSYPNPRPDPVRFMETHVNAIRFHELLTGRDIARELGAISLDSAPDTARLVVGTVLRGLGAAAVDPELVAELFRSESEADRQLAAGSISSLFAGAEPAATGVADQLMDRLLGAVIEGRDVWFPQLHGQEAGQRGTDIGRFSGERDDSAPRFLLKETLSATILSRWEDRVVLVDPAEWSARSSRLAATLYQPREVLRVGPFVRIGIDYTTRMDRAADEAPAGYAGGYTAYLLQTDEGWRVVATSIWIT
jgi:hypothetical protein